MRRLAHYLMVFLGLAVFYYCLFAVWPRNDDNASAYLRGLEILEGNWLMQGWKAGADSFIFCELPLFALLIKLNQGIRSFYQVAALCWSAVVCLSIYLACVGRDSRRTRAGFILAFLGIPLIQGNLILSVVADPLVHIGETAYMLACFALLHAFLQGKLSRGRALAAYLLVSFAAMAGDPMMTFVAVLPIAVTSLLYLSLTGRTAHQHRQILVVTAVAWLCGKLTVAWVHAHGLHIERADMRFCAFFDIPRNFWFLVWALLGFSGADFSGKLVTFDQLPGLALNFLKLSYLGFILAAWRSRTVEERGAGYLDSLLAVAVLVGSAACLFSSNVISQATTRYWLPSYIFLTILVARNLPTTTLARRLLTGIVASSLILGLASIDWKRVAHPMVTTPDQTHLITLLNQRHLQDGFGSYWLCHTITAATGGEIRIRPFEGGMPYIWLTNYRDYEPRRFRGNRVFFVHLKTNSNLDLRSRFGAPVEEFSSGDIQVEVFERDEQLLDSIFQQAEKAWKEDAGR
jgi:hypothetical protein